MDIQCGRLQVDVGETPVGDATRKMRDWLHLQSAVRRTDWCPCVARLPHTMHLVEIVEMLLEWSQKKKTAVPWLVSGSESARPQRSKSGRSLVGCCKGTSSLERDLTIEWDSLPGKGRSAGETLEQEGENRTCGRSSKKKENMGQGTQSKNKDRTEQRERKKNNAILQQITFLPVRRGK